MLEKRSDEKPYLPLFTFHKNHLLLADSHNSSWKVQILEDIIIKASLHKNIDITENEDELYHQYYNSFFKALKRTGGRAATARCLRYCLSVLEGKDYNEEKKHLRMKVRQLLKEK